MCYITDQESAKMLIAHEQARRQGLYTLFSQFEAILRAKADIVSLDQIANGIKAFE